jgi:thiol:disulfide interchange protein DsbD
MNEKKHMKRIVLLTLIAFSGLSLKAQLNPVSWSFSTVKTGDKQYEIRMVATIQQNWHLYSQVQPEDAIAIPTHFKFNANPLVSLEGKIQELGKMEKFTDKNLGVSANQYSNTVTFVQKLKMKAKAKTKLTGSVEYQTCDDHKCLPPKTVLISVDVK